MHLMQAVTWNAFIRFSISKPQFKTGNISIHSTLPTFFNIFNLRIGRYIFYEYIIGKYYTKVVRFFKIDLKL